MTNVRDLYSDCEVTYANGSSYFSAPANYSPLLHDLGRIVVQVDDEDYQGDSRLLYHQGGETFGILTFGWGSCSGCDSLQACRSYEDIESLRQELEDDINWFFSARDCMTYLREHNWELDYDSGDKRDQFLVEAKAYLQGFLSDTMSI